MRDLATAFHTLLNFCTSTDEMTISKTLPIETLLSTRFIRKGVART
jgi:hypothetical protein